MSSIIVLVLIELLIVAFIDIKTKKISNKWSLLNIVLCLVFHFSYPDLFPFSGQFFFFPVGWLVVGFILFQLKIMGAGDSKYMASLFLLTPLEFHLMFFSKLVSSTIIIGIFLILMKLVKNFQKVRAYSVTAYWGGIKDLIHSRISYAPVILVAWILMGASLWP